MIVRIQATTGQLRTTAVGVKPRTPYRPERRLLGRLIGRRMTDMGRFATVRFQPRQAGYLIFGSRRGLWWAGRHARLTWRRSASWRNAADRPAPSRGARGADTQRGAGPQQGPADRSARCRTLRGGQIRPHPLRRPPGDEAPRQVPAARRTGGTR